MAVTAQVIGAEAVMKSLANLKGAVQRRLVRGALTAAARVVAKEMKALAPRDSGLLKKSIGQVVRTYRNKGVTLAVIGPRRGFKRFVNRTRADGSKRQVMSDPVKYARLVEFGTEPHALGKGSDLLTKKKSKGKQHGLMHPGTRAQPFIRPALERKKAEAMNVFTQKLREGMEREAAKAAARGTR